MRVRFGAREVGPDRPCYVIAEAGANHDRDLDVARRLIDVCRRRRGRRGQVPDVLRPRRCTRRRRRASTISASSAPSPPTSCSRRSRCRGTGSRSSPRTAAIWGSSSCRARSTVDAVDELDALDVAAFKIASFELVDLTLVEYAASKGRPLILSTGMATLGEIEDAIECRPHGRRARGLPAAVRVALPGAARK